MSKDATTILGSAIRSVSGESPPVDLAQTFGQDFHTGLFMLVVSAVTGTLPTLDAFVQVEMPDGSFADLIAFQRMSGIGKRSAVASFPSGSFESIIKDAALLGGSVEGYPLGPVYMVRWLIAGTAGPSFTFTVVAHLYRSHPPVS